MKNSKVKMITDVEIIKNGRVYQVRSESGVWDTSCSLKDAERYCHECELTYTIHN